MSHRLPPCGRHSLCMTSPSGGEGHECLPRARTLTHSSDHSMSGIWTLCDSGPGAPLRILTMNVAT